MFETIDHIADIGIRVQAEDFSSLLRESVRGMFAQIADVEEISGACSQKIKLEGVDQTDLLINLLREFLYLFCSRRLAVKKLYFDYLSDTALEGEAECGWFDPQKHTLYNELKAVTYAGGEIETTFEGMAVTIIFDI